MDKEDLKAKFRSGMDKFVESSKKALSQAGNAVQDFSDKSVIRIEKHQLETKKDEQLKKLGSLAVEKFLNDDSAVLSASEEAVVTILEEIRRLNTDIAEREEKLKAEATEPQENS
ncbi:MAG: hypothetical protein II098_08575 [Treponema sp.]|jgi:hypothetical protein|nr:hypothetical protein [Treponema sp.]